MSDTRYNLAVSQVLDIFLTQANVGKPALSRRHGMGDAEGWLWFYLVGTRAIPIQKILFKNSKRRYAP